MTAGNRCFRRSLNLVCSVLGVSGGAFGSPVCELGGGGGAGVGPDAFTTATFIGDSSTSIAATENLAATETSPSLTSNCGCPPSLKTHPSLTTLAPAFLASATILVLVLP